MMQAEILAQNNIGIIMKGRIGGIVEQHDGKKALISGLDFHQFILVRFIAGISFNPYNYPS